MAYNILEQGFCPPKIKITQFPDGCRLNTLTIDMHVVGHHH